ncbi:hypothetical protein EVAR_20748_1 [Eumeta japonica]|uniref:Uncharacterized protein n=1 Tax=Eumeta variegata TaxID=151549 RepID=A0A4C1VCN1_EUMVA|nr:hypothetical protein EVAR_20748_1 [Eumeta japonica]
MTASFPVTAAAKLKQCRFVCNSGHGGKRIGHGLSGNRRRQQRRQRRQRPRARGQKARGGEWETDCQCADEAWSAGLVWHKLKTRRSIAPRSGSVPISAGTKSPLLSIEPSPIFEALVETNTHVIIESDNISVATTHDVVPGRSTSHRRRNNTPARKPLALRGCCRK